MPPVAKQITEQQDMKVKETCTTGVWTWTSDIVLVPVVFKGPEEKIREERHEMMETEGGLQTVWVREEREYLSLSSWVREGSEGGEQGKWRKRERCQRSMTRMEEDGKYCCFSYKRRLVFPLIQDACFHSNMVLKSLKIIKDLSSVTPCPNCMQAEFALFIQKTHILPWK